MEEELLVRHCDESRYVLLNYKDISQSGVVQFARARGCRLVLNERMARIVKTKLGDVVLTENNWYEC